MAYYYTTDVENAGERLDYWRDLLAKSVVPLDVQPFSRQQPRHAFDGGIQVGALGDLVFPTVTAASHQVRRTPHMVAQGDYEIYSLFLQVSGTCQVARGDRRDLIRPGDMMVLDSSDTYDLRFAADHQVVCVHIPQSKLTTPRGAVSEIVGARLPTNEGVGALMWPFLTQLARQTQTSQLAAPERLAGTVIDLTEAMLTERLGALERQPEPPRRVLLMRIRQDIEQHLASPELSAEALAGKHHITISQLHALFESIGVTVDQWIQERRLERCRRDLRDPAMDLTPANAVGARWGMPNPTTFEQVFTARFKATPNDYRLQHRI